MARLLLEFDSLEIPGNPYVKTRKIMASEQALEVMRIKHINVDSFVESLKQLMRDFGMHWAYISKCRTEIQINMTRVVGPRK